MILTAKDLPSRATDAEIQRDARSILNVLLAFGPAACPKYHHPNALHRLVMGRVIVADGWERVGSESRRRFRIADKARALAIVAGEARA